MRVKGIPSLHLEIFRGPSLLIYLFCLDLVSISKCSDDVLKLITFGQKALERENKQKFQIEALIELEGKGSTFQKALASIMPNSHSA
jgi:hypothetical protein